MSGRAEMGRLVKTLQREGFEVDRTGSGHWKVTNPNGPGGTVIMSFSPNGSALKNAVRDLRKIGFKK